MKVFFLGIFVLVLGIVSPVYASLLRFEGTPHRAISSQGLSIPVYAKATFVQKSAPEVPLFLTGAGIYLKPVVFLQAPVIVAMSYTDLQGGINVQSPMESVKKARVKVMHMTALQMISSNEIQSLIEAALEKNGIDLSDPGVNEALNKIVFSGNSGDVAVMYGVSELGSETQSLLLEVGKEVVNARSPLIADTFWNMWFGVPLDSGIAKLKRQLLSGN